MSEYERVADKVMFSMALALVSDAVNEKGSDFVYTANPGTGCTYVDRDHEGTAVPGCLVGHALINLGVAIDTFEELEINVNCGAAIAISELTLAGVLDGTTDKARDFLAEAQSEQDSHLPWGQAVKRAIEFVSTLNYDENETRTRREL